MVQSFANRSGGFAKRSKIGVGAGLVPIALPNTHCGPRYFPTNACANPKISRRNPGVSAESGLTVIFGFAVVPVML